MRVIIDGYMYGKFISIHTIYGIIEGSKYAETKIMALMEGAAEAQEDLQDHT
ncbi:hypothetical protein J7L18_00175 [Candidatus Bathyarchaeota archaeon]|nr:hypothetical protein [Candidatus Bathyarchaeota archaeon]